MVSIIAFIIVMFGSLNWLSIGFFQYDIVAGFFGYQGSLFSRIVYIIVGISACWLLFSVIKNKGRLNPQKLKHDEMPMYDKHAKMEKAVRDYEQESQAHTQSTIQESQSHQNRQVENNSLQTAQNTPEQNTKTNRNHDNFNIWLLLKI